jgi:tRNA(His) 5'-end guanylyltransferase
MAKDSLGDRMKSYYEAIPNTRLVRRMPVIIRIDGKAFHTFTKGFNKPYDIVLSNAMIRTMKDLCSNIQGCVFGYTQSDEITLVLVDYNRLETSAWFDYKIQKMCSVSASMATAYFNKNFASEVFEYKQSLFKHTPYHPDTEVFEKYKIFKNNIDTAKNVAIKYEQRIEKNIAMFDARCFNIPKEEVCNCLIWRQQDATRNSIEMLGRAYFSDKELHKKNCSNIQDMLMELHNVNWNNVDTIFKRGCACHKHAEESGNCSWVVDFEMPILTQDRDYVEKHIMVGE